MGYKGGAVGYKGGERNRVRARMRASRRDKRKGAEQEKGGWGGKNGLGLQMKGVPAGGGLGFRSRLG